MNKVLFFAAAGALMLASCASDEMVNPVEKNGPENGAIGFMVNAKNQTRANLQDWNDNFGVWAFKYNEADGVPSVAAGALATNPQVVMNNYKVQYTNSPSWETTLNYNWYYAGVNGQFLKYWDLSYEKTAFFAYTPYRTAQVWDAGTMSFGKVKYTRSAKKAEVPMFAYAIETNNLHAGVDGNQINQPDTTDKPGNPVSLHFTRGLSQVELKIWEDIPGYYVTIDNIAFEKDGDGTKVAAVAADFLDSYIPKDDESNLLPGVTFIPFTKTTDTYALGAFIESADLAVNMAASPFAFNSVYSNGDKTNAKPFNFAFPAGTIGNTCAGATASTDSWFVVPVADLGTNDGFQVVLNFTLHSEDTGEIIKVRGARVDVEASDYTQWAKNTHYTYIFRITRNTSGTTKGDVIPELTPVTPTNALYPIIFDSITIDNYNTNVTQEWVINPSNNHEDDAPDDEEHTPENAIKPEP